MQMVEQDPMILEDESTTNLITVGGDVDSEYDSVSCHTVSGERDEASIFVTKSDDEDNSCALAMAFTEDDLLLGSQSHNRPSFINGHTFEQKVNQIFIDGCLGVNLLPLRIVKKLGVPTDELGNIHLMI